MRRVSLFIYLSTNNDRTLIWLYFPRYQTIPFEKSSWPKPKHSRCFVRFLCFYFAVVTCYHSTHTHARTKKLMYQQLEWNKLHWSQYWLQKRWKWFQKPNALWKYVPLQCASCVPVQPQHRDSHLSQPTHWLQNTHSLHVKRCFLRLQPLWLKKGSL